MENPENGHIALPTPRPGALAGLKPTGADSSSVRSRLRAVWGLSCYGSDPIWLQINTYRYLLGQWTPIYQLFWCELQGYRVLTYTHISLDIYVYSWSHDPWGVTDRGWEVGSSLGFIPKPEESQHFAKISIGKEQEKNRLINTFFRFSHLSVLFRADKAKLALNDLTEGMARPQSLAPYRASTSGQRWSFVPYYSTMSSWGENKFQPETQQQPTCHHHDPRWSLGIEAYTHW